MGLLAFGYAQVTYSLIILVGYIGYFLHYQPNSFHTIFPHTTKGKWLDLSLLKSTWIFTLQSIFKWLITEGERLVLKFSVALIDQDIYSVINSLGSLVARSIFQPVEEIAFSMFSKLNNDISTFSKDEKLKNPSLEGLTTIIKFMILIGLVFSCFGPNYSSLLLEILYRGSLRHTNASSALALYCVYVLTMAVNGITEAFVYAVASTDDIKTINYLLVLLSIIYVTLSTLLLRLIGTSGLILANCVNMCLRILWNCNYIYQYFKKLNMHASLVHCLPAKQVLLAFGFSFCITWLSESVHPRSLYGYASHVGIGVIAAIFVLLAIVKYEQQFIHSCRVLFALRS